MSSDLLGRMTQAMREADGKPVGAVRDVALRAVGAALDSYYSLRRRISPSPRLHPLLKVVCDQVGEPTERWPVEDVTAFRAKFESLTAFMTSATRSKPVWTNYSLGGGRSLGGFELAPRSRAAIHGVRLVFLHGGGFVIGDAKASLPEADYLCNEVGVAVSVLEYPLAPEVPFPGALLDVAEFLKNCAENGERLVLVGESAGGNLAMASVLEDHAVRDAVVAMVLAYPLLDLTLTSSSMNTLGTGFFLTKRMLEWFVSSYLGDESAADARHPGASPLFSGSLDDLPPVLAVVGEFDPLLDDARSLANSCDRVQLAVVPGMIHGFLEMRGILGQRETSMRMMADFIGTHLALEKAQ